MSRFEIYAKILGIPPEILDFAFNVFDLYEVRGRVGNIDKIIFEVRTRESNHNIPHVHVAYADFNISISILDGRVLSGNLPTKKEKIAKEWIFNNREYLLSKWSTLTLKRELPFLRSSIHKN